jgi:NAD(P)-dependent dehydrogenase (short-subunit alcohol dehydrogenase family)
MSFESKLAIVTGAAQGMGAAYARLLAQRGAAVVVADIQANAAEAVARSIRAEGGRAVAHATDVGDPASCLACASAATQAFGRIDYLVNNAGLLSASFAAPLPELAVDKYLRIVAVNMHSVLYMTQAVVPAMKAAGGGAIVNTSSIGSWMKTGIYSVSKAGVNALTVNLSQTLGPLGIRVNAIAPGTTATEGMQPIMTVEQMGQWAQALGKPTAEVAAPEMIARVGIFLLSDDAHYINGQIVPVDGGTIVRL